MFDYSDLVELATACGARRPVWRGDEEIAQCWRDRAEWLVRLHREGDGDLAAAIDECDLYADAGQ